MNGYAIGRQNGWMSANDIRELENFDRIPAENGGDLYLINGNMLPLKDAGAFANIICGDCGAFFGSKVWNSTSKYRRVIWQCNNKFKGEHKCETPHLDEETIKTRFVGAFNAILADKDSALENCRLMQSALTDCSGLDAEIESLLEEIEVVTELTKRCIAENSQTAQNQEEYAAQYNGFVERYEKAKARVEELHRIKSARQAQADAIGAFMFDVQELDTLSEFDEKLWLTVIDTVTVHTDGRMTFKFQDGTEIDV